MGHLGMNFRWSIIVAKLWRLKSQCTEKNHFLLFLEKRPLKNWKGFIATPIDVLRSNFVKFGRREIGKVVRYLPDKNFPRLSSLATARIVPKICRGQPQTMYSECFGFHPNRFTFGRVIPERVNTTRVRSKVNPIFGWSLALSRIINRTLLRQTDSIKTF